MNIDMSKMRMRPAYDSGRHYAANGLTPDWAALWISRRLDAFSRGYEAELAMRRAATPDAVGSTRKRRS
jgi:hypothetical protein